MIHFDGPRDLLRGRLISGDSNSSQLHLASESYLAFANKFPQFIIVSWQSFTQRNLDRFGATWLLKRGKSVHLVDLSLLIWGKSEIRADPPDAVEGVLRPASWDSLEEFLGRHRSNSLLLVHLAPYSVLPLFELVKKYSLSTLYFDDGRSPSRSLVRTIGTIVQSLASDPKDLWRRAFRKLQERPHPQLHLDYFVMSGQDCEVNPPKWLRHARVTVPSHSYDYVIWDSSHPFAHDEPYIVFLDQAFPDHSDPIKTKVRNPFKKEVYYPQIVGFLKHVSAMFQMPVLVALHPRSPYASGNGPYRAFQAFSGQTASLVKGARLVVAHDSRAISFAVLGRKPLLLVRLDQREKELQFCIDTFAHVLGAPIVHVNSRSLPALGKLSVNASKYAWYEAMYIRHPACNGIHVWDRIFGSNPQR